MGAIAMIAGAAVEPFTQQVISLMYNLDPYHAGTTNVTVAYSQNFVVKPALTNRGKSQIF